MSSGSEATPAANTGATPRRRSSGFMPAFEGLQQLRSNGAARRQSLNDQQAKPGFFGQIFHNNFGRNAK
ncbi:hypothetical protein ESCO_004816 [Escovopsis weberi]|uniref:Conidiation-specific protein 8 n=1 Tax=Escovopsis weberi TaxID=150374 RepID=A0A0M8MQ03_ESCWE|nr:hypothetical protein ESCO_004816 [Escovopsis weberi]